MALRYAIHAFVQLLFPSTCPACGKVLTDIERFVCLDCNLSAPYTNLWQSRDNAMEQRFWGQVAIERAAAFLWFTEQSVWRTVIHNFKYRSHWYYAESMGRWFATELLRSDFLEGIDTIVPVPLHPFRRLVRGYNQSEYIAAAISRQASIPYCFNAVRRIRNNPPQSTMQYRERWENSSSLFAVTHPEKLIGKHILLVDDVFTTGATLISLAQTITAACNGNVKISVATLAVSRHIVDL